MSAQITWTQINPTSWRGTAKVGDWDVVAGIFGPSPDGVCLLAWPPENGRWCDSVELAKSAAEGLLNEFAEGAREEFLLMQPEGRA